MFNQRRKVQKVKVESNIVDLEAIKRFYFMLVKYKESHPSFNLKLVILKIYPSLNWKEFISKEKL